MSPVDLVQEPWAEHPMHALAGFLEPVHQLGTQQVYCGRLSLPFERCPSVSQE
jgi:hypothetical protein